MEHLKYGTRYHRGGLKESLETTKYITKEEFEKLLPLYDGYAYDNRVNQILFIRKNLEKNYKDPSWLFIEFPSYMK